METDNRTNGSRTYLAIDLKSFYASVECVERGLDPLTTNLVVADESRTEKTICLAVSPSMKAHGIGGRARLFEVVRRMREVNGLRRQAIGYRPFKGKSVSDTELKSDPELEADYIKAVPRMAFYIQYSTRVYQVYLKYIAPEDIHVYSIDEVFIDVTDYLVTAKTTARELAVTMVRDVLRSTGITATAGIGTNMYLAKVAMDIVAKHIPADKDGVRVAELDEMSYRRMLWNHRPLTSFWRVGHGIADRLAPYGIDTMGKIARCSVHNEELLYRLFGVNAELLIDHAWGWEPCTMEMVKAYKPESNSMGSGQVLACPYDAAKARVVVKEMADGLAFDLLDKKLVTDQLVMGIGYDSENLGSRDIMERYEGEMATDYYGRRTPKPAHGAIKLDAPTSSAMIITDAATRLFDRIVDTALRIRRINLTANHVVDENRKERKKPVQLDMFADNDRQREQEEKRKTELAKERKMREAILRLKKRFGKNSILRGLNFQEGATATERNMQIGGHKA